MPAKRLPSMLGLAIVTAFGLTALQSGEGYSATPQAKTAITTTVPGTGPMWDDDWSWGDGGGSWGGGAQHQEQSQASADASDSTSASVSESSCTRFSRHCN